MPYTRPAATDGALKPPPSFPAFQASGGPLPGQRCSSPVSRDIALRSGPCHCGQSKEGARGGLISRAARPAGTEKTRSSNQAQRFGMNGLLKDVNGEANRSMTRRGGNRGQTTATVSGFECSAMAECEQEKPV